MKKLGKIEAILAKLKEELGSECKVKEIGIFGSYVRGEQKKHSDLDLSDEFEETTDLKLLGFTRL